MNRISIFHYHLHPGGVTNVILLGAAALIKHFPNLQLLRLVCGSRENTDIIKNRLLKEIDSTGLIADTFKFEICIEPEIGYASYERVIEEKEIKDLADRLLQKYGDSLWWIHNYQLGKNPLFTAAVTRISDSLPAQKMLLHIHDFPECARYDNLQNLRTAGVTDPYPAGAGTAYALINGRDRAIVQKAGIPEEKVFLVNNPVEDDDTTMPEISQQKLEILKRDYLKHYSKIFPRVSADAKLLLYPVRTIRRKNALEAGLIAAVSEYPVNLVLSLPGTSAQEKAYSDICEECFRTGLIPGIWGSGADSSAAVPSYPQMLQLCDLILSSSVQEGFGYLFINSVLLGVPLIARDLDILDGIRQFFPEEHCYFYNSLIVPVDKSEAEEIRSLYLNKLKSIRQYISAEAADRISSRLAAVGSGGCADFSFLSVEKQAAILKKLKSSADLMREIRTINSGLLSRVYSGLDSGRYSGRTEIETFSLRKHSAAVESIIQILYSNNSKEYKLENVQQSLLDHFAEPEYMRLLYDY